MLATDLHRFRPRLEALERRIQPATTLPANFAETTLVSGLTQPTAMEFAPDGRLFVAEKGGTLRVVKDGTLLPTPFLTVRVNSLSERGLVGVTLDPNFAVNHFVYVFYTVPDAIPFNRVSRFTTSAGNPDVADPSSEVVLIDNIASTAGNHNGGGLHFGADGMLYVGVGDSGVSSNGQDLGTLSGKILRIDPAAFPNVVPPDNPFVNTPGARGEIWALGLRNPFSFAVQPGTGKIYANDTGDQFEEIDQIVRGGNYGWPVRQGNAGDPNFIDPVFSYPTAPGAIVGGTFYQGAAFPAGLRGSYFFGDFDRGTLSLLTAAGAEEPFATGIQNPVDIDVGPDGSLYVLSIATGSVSRIAFTGVPANLSAPPLVVGAGAGGGPQVRVLNPDGSERLSFFAYEAGFTGGVRVAAGDVNGDGVADVITAPGPGGGPVVKAFDGATGNVLRSFLAFEPTFTGGAFVASGDFDRDGFADVVVSADQGGGPRVRIFSGKDGSVLADFLGIDDPNFRGGARVAVGDVNGDGTPDLMVAAGFGGGPRVAIFDGRTLKPGATPGKLVADFFVFEQTLRNGAFVAAGDLNGDGAGDVIAGGGPGGGPRVFAISGKDLLASGGTTLTPLANFFAGDVNGRGGVPVAARDLDGDGRADLITGAGAGSPPLVQTFAGKSFPTGGTPAAVRQLDAFDPNFTGGVFVG